MYLESIKGNNYSPDVLSWHLTETGNYSAASAYGAMFLGSSPVRGAAQLWKTVAPPRVRLSASSIGWLCRIDAGPASVVTAMAFNQRTLASPATRSQRQLITSCWDMRTAARSGRPGWTGFTCLMWMFARSRSWSGGCPIGSASTSTSGAGLTPSCS